MRALRNRQDLFQEEGILNLILDAIDKITTITGQGFMVALAGDAAGQSWDCISAYLYQLLGNVNLISVETALSVKLIFILFAHTQLPSLRETTPIVPNLPSLTG